MLNIALEYIPQKISVYLNASCLLAYDVNVLAQSKKSAEKTLVKLDEGAKEERRPKS